MRVFSLRPFVSASERYPTKTTSLRATHKALEASIAQTPEELKTTFASLDNFTYRDGWWVIDIGGNDLRLIAHINFQTQTVFVKHILSHDEYDKANKWYRSPRNKGVMQ